MLKIEGLSSWVASLLLNKWYDIRHVRAQNSKLTLSKCNKSKPAHTGAVHSVNDNHVQIIVFSVAADPECSVYDCCN